MSVDKTDQMLSAIPQSPLGMDVRAFLLDAQARRLSRRTVGVYARELLLLCRHLEQQEINQVQAIETTHLRSYLLHLEQTGHTVGGQHLAYRVMKTFLRWYQAEEEPENWKNPILKVKPPKLNDEPLPPVPIDDVRKMAATCMTRTFADQRDKAILLCLLDSGCRAEEFVSLNLADIDVATGALMIRRGKGGKGRVTFVGAQARKELVRYLRYRPEAKPTDPVWVTVSKYHHNGTRLSYNGLRQIVRRRACSAGVPEPPLHSFRRAFAINSLRAGTDLISLQRLLGHADLETTRRYLRQTQQDLQEVHRRASPVDNLLAVGGGV